MRYAGVTFVCLAMGIALAGGDPPQPVLVKASVPLTDDVVSALSGKATHVSFVWREIGWFAASATSAQVAALASDARVACVVPDRERFAPSGEAFAPAGSSEAAATESDDPRVTWNLDMADTPGSGYDGTGVTVAVLDSGLPLNWEDYLPEGSVDTEHAAGFGSVGWGSGANPVQAITGEGGYLGTFPHGLAVSSVIVGFKSDHGLISGAAPGAKILPIRIREEHAWDSWIAAGILYVASLKESGELPGPVVINLSIQFAEPAPVVVDAIDYAIDHGVLFVTAAGNAGPDAGSISTHISERAIAVGMVGWVEEAGLDPDTGFPSAGIDWAFDDVPEDDAAQVYVAGISSRESDPPASPTLIDVVGPGSLPVVLWLRRPGFSSGRQEAYEDDHIIGEVGTSFAAPHVAGIVAQMLQKNPSLTQEDAEAILRATALAIPADSDGVVTPMFVPETPFGPGSMYWGPWGANATGAGLARGTAAVAATPLP